MSGLGIWAGAALLITLVGVLLWFRREGYRAAEGDAAKRGVEDARKSEADRETVKRLSDSKLDDELRGA